MEEFRRKKMERQKLAKAASATSISLHDGEYTNGGAVSISHPGDGMLAIQLDGTRFPPPSPQIQEMDDAHAAAPHASPALASHELRETPARPDGMPASGGSTPSSMRQQEPQPTASPATDVVRASTPRY